MKGIPHFKQLLFRREIFCVCVDYFNNVFSCFVYNPAAIVQWLVDIVGE